MARMYDLTSKTVDPLSEFLKSVVEVNARKTLAEGAGWLIELSIDESEDALDVSIRRSETWPTDIEGEQAK